jgi:peptide/nickel transport system substrate-binding protein
MVLKESYGLVLRSLAKAGNPPFMMPERVAKTPAKVQIKETIGSGPFTFKADEWQPGHKVVFERNKDYVPRKEPADLLSGGKIVKIDRLEWLYIPDNNTTLSALTAGEIDYFEAPPLEYIQILKKNPDIVVQKIDPLGVQGLIRPNHLYPPFNNPKARHALLYLVDQEEFMGSVVGTPDLHLKYCGTFFMCGSENETSAGLEGLGKPNLEKAKQLFEEAGYNGESIVVLQPTDRPQYNAATMVLIQQLRKAGLNVQPKAADWSTISSLRAKNDPPSKGGWHLFITSHGDPETATPLGNNWFNSRCERANPGWPCDPALMDLVDKWARATDKKEQRKLIDDIQIRALETVPYVPYGQYFQPIAVRSNVRGVLKSPHPVYWNIEKR